MPAGCEERFGWGKGHKILDTKYPYGENLKWLDMSAPMVLRLIKFTIITNQWL